jgi:transcriptional regulator with XRE-family HTH domain
MHPHERVKEARLRLGLSESEVARRAGLSIHEYGDVEQHADEIYTIVALGDVRRLCAVLQLDLLELLGLSEGNEPSTHPEITRSEIVRQRLSELGLTPADLADRIGYEEHVGIALAANPDVIETLTLDTISEVAKALQVPLRQLLERKI